jgi:cystathionine beta-synthase
MEGARSEVAESVLDLIGGTPIVKVNRLAGAHGVRATITLKLEPLNPGGSAKDRVAVAMIDAAERDGLLQPGGTIVEPTSGNTGVGLAIVAAQRGYHCVFVCTDKVSPTKLDLLRAYGAEVVVCPVSVPPEDPNSYYATAERLAREIPGAFRPNQYANPHNPLAHERTTGPEIWRQTAGGVTHFVAGMGTGGTITGTARYLKARNPDIVIVGADAESSVYTGGSGRPYLVEGIGEDFFPATMDLSLVDRAYPVSDEDCFLMAREVAQREGILIGGSGGAAVAAALHHAREADLDERHLVVVLVPDSGRGYLNHEFNDTWMYTFGFLHRDGPTVASLLAERGTDVPELLYVNPEQTLGEAIDLMRTHDVSQIPVIKNRPPFANAEVVGAVDELQLMHLVTADAANLHRPVGQVVGAKLPTVGIGEAMRDAVRRLEDANALLVLKGGRPCCVLTRADVLRHLRSADPAVPVGPHEPSDGGPVDG